MAAVPDTTPSHLQGNGRPTTEEQTITELKVTGSIPAELDGRYVRNGANPLGEVDLANHHWFTGEGMVHGVKLQEGQALWYRNRYVRSAEIVEALGEDPAGRQFAGSANTHVIGHAERTFAIVEAGSPPVELSYELDTVGANNFFGTLPDMAFTAHPKICPRTGEMLGFGYGMAPPYLTYHRVSADGELVQSTDIELPAPVMMHDFNVTDSRVVFMDLPVVFDLDRAMAGTMPFAFEPDNGARLGVMPRDGDADSIHWVDVEPCYVFHPMNSYEEGDSIVLDVARFEHIWRDSSMDFPPPVLWRWTIDMKSGKVTEEQIDDRSAEFPRVADSVIGLKHRYGYMMGMSLDADPDAVAKAAVAGMNFNWSGQSCGSTSRLMLQLPKTVIFARSRRHVVIPQILPILTPSREMSQVF